MVTMAEISYDDFYNKGNPSPSSRPSMDVVIKGKFGSTKGANASVSKSTAVIFFSGTFFWQEKTRITTKNSRTDWMLRVNFKNGTVEFAYFMRL
jgi:hypothetical protein